MSNTSTTVTEEMVNSTLSDLTGLESSENLRVALTAMKLHMRNEPLLTSVNTLDELGLENAEAAEETTNARYVAKIARGLAEHLLASIAVDLNATLTSAKESRVGSIEGNESVLAHWANTDICKFSKAIFLNEMTKPNLYENAIRTLVSLLSTLGRYGLKSWNAEDFVKEMDELDTRLRGELHCATKNEMMTQEKDILIDFTDAEERERITQRLGCFTTAINPFAEDGLPQFAEEVLSFRKINEELSSEGVPIDPAETLLKYKDGLEKAKGIVEYLLALRAKAFKLQTILMSYVD